ncbi:MAG: PDZ domain-containing protein, partial [Bacillota bacterium]|nr:PDZ domain-containing protein [Bacillota bacterium]
MKNKKTWIAVTLAILIFTNTVTFIIANKVSLFLPNGKVEISRKMYNDVMDFNKLFTAKDIIENLYIGKEDKQAMEEGALKGMTDSLKDPYTVYMNKTEWGNLNSQTQGNYSGIGVTMDTTGTYVKVDNVTRNSPAEKAGVLKGDLIKKVNGKDVTADNAASLI